MLGTPYEVTLVKEPNDIQFREVKMPGEKPAHGKEGEHMKLNLRNMINPGYDLPSKFKHSGPINLMEFSNEYGVLFYALENTLY